MFLGSFCTVCGPHRHVAARNKFNLKKKKNFKKTKKKKFSLRIPFGVLPIIMVLGNNGCRNPRELL